MIVDSQDLEDLLQSRNVAYQRFISTQDHVMVSERRKQDASKSKSFQGPKDRHRVVQQEESPVLLRRGDVQVAQSMSHRVVQQSRNSEVYYIDSYACLACTMLINCRQHTSVLKQVYNNIAWRALLCQVLITSSLCLQSLSGLWS